MSRQKNSILINEHALNREPVPLMAYIGIRVNGISVVNEMLLKLNKPLQIDRLKFSRNVRRFYPASVSLKALVFIEDLVIVTWFLALPMKAFTINSFLWRQCK